MSLPALPVTADTRSITERVNVLIRDYNTLLGVPPGCIMPYAGATAPEGWLLCHGQAVSRTTYADLFAAIGTAHGAGDGSTTFNCARPARSRRRRPRRHGRHRRRPDHRRRLRHRRRNARRRRRCGNPHAQHGRRCRRTAHTNAAGSGLIVYGGGSGVATFAAGAALPLYTAGLTASRRRRCAQQHAADAHPQLRDRDMTLLRERYAGLAPATSDLPAEALAKAGAPQERRRMSPASPCALSTSPGRSLDRCSSRRSGHRPTSLTCLPSCWSRRADFGASTTTVRLSPPSSRRSRRTAAVWCGWWAAAACATGRGRSWRRLPRRRAPTAVGRSGAPAGVAGRAWCQSSAFNALQTMTADRPGNGGSHDVE